MPVIGDETDDCRHLERARSNWKPPRDRSQKLTMTGPFHAGHADNLARVNGERRVPDSNNPTFVFDRETIRLDDNPASDSCCGRCRCTVAVERL